MKSVDKAWLAAMAKLPTPLLSRALKNILAKQAPPRHGNIRPKLRYAHQGGSNPPIIIIHGNALEHVPQHAGAASAMLGCLQNLMGAASGLVVAVVFPWLDILGITLSMAALGGLALLAWHITEAQERVA